MLLCSLVLNFFLKTTFLSASSNGYTFVNLNKDLELSSVLAAKSVVNFYDRSELRSMLEIEQLSVKNETLNIRVREIKYPELEISPLATEQDNAVYLKMIEQARGILMSNPAARLELEKLIQIQETEGRDAEAIAFHWDVAFDQGFLLIAAELARTGHVVGVVYGSRSELRLIEDINRTLPEKYWISAESTPEKLASVLEGRGAQYTTILTTHEVMEAPFFELFDDVIILPAEPVFQKPKVPTSPLINSLDNARKTSRYLSQMV